MHVQLCLMKKKISNILAFFITFTLISLTAAHKSSTSSHATTILTDSQASFDKQRQLFSYSEQFVSGGELESVSVVTFENFRLRSAYVALQAWKQAIISDPLNLTLNWVGSDVCNYTGVFCSPAPDDPSVETVAGIDLNHGDLAGSLPQDLGLLTDIALFHINSNRFCGKVPWSFKKLKHLFELDLSNNRFAGKFSYVVLHLPNLKFLDLRFNEFEGRLPKALFDKDLDAIFINHNRFAIELPSNLGNSSVSVLVLANNRFHGCVPMSLGNMSNTLNEVILMNNGLHSCLPKGIGLLRNLTIFDVRYNKLMGELPDSFGEMVA